ncbi:bifunctional 2-C-methyl-D-erythritol 4-phosphate cytidylyltransferase/2-C-methyl-D-erythritol 2,4-cyclodiphosphate synthase [Pelagibius litoralis]|uniref:bifunctional 2-C-methyl-D-erythritol 4-phosphate cytidylyltransferase/2-C-methyl-D-erythritol 2,4-cyclodiphosphate synthase n=1 Tax=Pelagibius litoralis TaxID=374515 RepID=UPI002AC356EC|nr:bifunctional 2-C-methyl-D-erythritol 4-phosphate cytidylyltransferase/2-C-methyl-D-erythritol 2,4-cyclodiphosphate synthase [Pelagibius litoralis]
MTTAAALIVAAGRGQRFGGALPKQYAKLGGVPVLRHSLVAFLAHPQIGRVRAVIHPDDRDLYDEAAEGLPLDAPVPGGDSRQHSVRLGLESLEQDAPDLVLIHDGARPFISQQAIGRVLGALQHAAGAIVAQPVVDTLKRGLDGCVAGTQDRDGLWRAQTPQGFRYDDIAAAHRAVADRALTDDAAVAELAGLSLALVEGGQENIKVTTQEDLEGAERWLRGGLSLETRVGQGFDVHVFGPGDHVTLCGLRLDHSAGLVGHSDADVGLHALTDAILGALSAGDIGSHFPPDDPQWKGADSAVFISHARDMVAARGGHIRHVDLTLICERPKIGPHRAAMITRVASLLDLPEERVSIKATTTEKLGFLGRGEGIAAQAMATLALPAGS